MRVRSLFVYLGASESDSERERGGGGGGGGVGGALLALGVSACSSCGSLC